MMMVMMMIVMMMMIIITNNNFNNIENLLSANPVTNCHRMFTMIHSVKLTQNNHTYNIHQQRPSPSSVYSNESIHQAYLKAIDIDKTQSNPKINTHYSPIVRYHLLTCR